MTLKSIDAWSYRHTTKVILLHSEDPWGELNNFTDVMQINHDDDDDDNDDDAKTHTECATYRSWQNLQTLYKCITVVWQVHRCDSQHWILTDRESKRNTT